LITYTGELSSAIICGQFPIRSQVHAVQFSVIRRQQGHASAPTDSFCFFACDGLKINNAKTLRPCVMYDPNCRRIIKNFMVDWRSIRARLCIDGGGGGFN
jgi:hypothetical protein